MAYFQQRFDWLKVPSGKDQFENPSKGTFTCPYDGIYSFYATSSVIENSGNIYIYVNGFNMVHHHANMPNMNEQTHISPNGILKLKQGDTVQISMSGKFNYANANKNGPLLMAH